eukprot:Gb_23490 [translate_table: standard]
MHIMENEMGVPVATHLLQHTLRSICMESQWVYAVLWRILPRNYPPPKWDTEDGIYDRSRGNRRNWILVWEDGFCDFSATKQVQIGSSGQEKSLYKLDEYFQSGLQPELFFKMSHEVYNYGEGLIGKVAAEKNHKWIFRDPLQHEINYLSPWHNSIDPHPRTWEAQFNSGIQTIALIAVREGLLQLGATQKVVEDLNCVILLQRKFNYLLSIPGVFLPHPSSLPLFTNSEARAKSEESIGILNQGSGRSFERCFSWNGSTSNQDDDRNQDLNPRPEGHYTNQTLKGGMWGTQNLMNHHPMLPHPALKSHCHVNSPASTVTPSMSSLQALLSKLPSVTPPSYQSREDLAGNEMSSMISTDMEPAPQHMDANVDPAAYSYI